MPFYEDYGNEFHYLYGPANTNGNLAGMHLHPHYEVLIVPMASEQNHTIYGNKTPVVYQPSMTVFAPYVMHQVVFTPERGTERFVFYLGKKFLDEFSSLFRSFLAAVPYPMTRFLLSDELVAEIRSFLDFSCRHQRDPELAKPNAICLLNHLAKNATLEYAQKPMLGIEKYQEIIYYISHHYDEPLTADSVADRFFISRSKLDQDFNRIFHLSFHKLLSDIRISNARLQLIQTNKSIQEIARSVGFEQYSNFFVFFKNHVGISPAEFRKKGK